MTVIGTSGGSALWYLARGSGVVTIVFLTVSVLLGIYVNVNFLWFTLFVGLNLLQSGFSNWCPMMAILRRSALGAGVES